MSLCFHLELVCKATLQSPSLHGLHAAFTSQVVPASLGHSPQIDGLRWFPKALPEMPEAGAKVAGYLTISGITSLRSSRIDLSLCS